MDDNFKNELIEELANSLKSKDSDSTRRINSIENTKCIKLLPREDLIKALDEKGIEYDRNKVEDAYFPLEDVEACMNDVESAYPNHRPCPLCGKRSEELRWICFRSPNWTWDKLTGTSGSMSICPDCGCIVEYICFIIN